MPQLPSAFKRSSRRRLLLPLAGAAMFLAPAAEAAAQNNFTCRASLVRVSGQGLLSAVQVEPVVANRQNNPCTAQNTALVPPLAPLTLPAGLGSVDLLFARTNTEAQKFSRAEAGVAVIVLSLPGAPVITAEVLTARAAATCPGGGRPPAFESGGTIVRLQVGNQEIVNLDDPLTIPIGVGTIFLNRTIEERNAQGGAVTRRALEVDVPGVANVVVSEAIADYRGNPCGNEQTRFPGWMTGGGWVAQAGTKHDRNAEGTVDPGDVEHHAFSIDCFFPTRADAGKKDHLNVKWTDDAGREHARFKAELIEDARCFSDGNPEQPRSRFNTVEGSAIGICTTRTGSFPIRMQFRLSDNGEPGRNDRARFVGGIAPGAPTPPELCTVSSDGFLDGGNHQAHQTPAQFRTPPSQTRARTRTR